MISREAINIPSALMPAGVRRSSFSFSKLENGLLEGELSIRISSPKVGCQIEAGEAMRSGFVRANSPRTGQKAEKRFLTLPLPPAPPVTTLNLKDSLGSHCPIILEKQINCA